MIYTYSGNILIAVSRAALRVGICGRQACLALMSTPGPCFLPGIQQPAHRQCLAYPGLPDCGSAQLIVGASVTDSGCFWQVLEQTAMSCLTVAAYGPHAALVHGVRLTQHDLSAAGQPSQAPEAPLWGQDDDAVQGCAPWGAQPPRLRHRRAGQPGLAGWTVCGAKLSTQNTQTKPREPRASTQRCLLAASTPQHTASLHPTSPSHTH